MISLIRVIIISISLIRVILIEDITYKSNAN